MKNMKDLDYLVIGAGPGGIQLAYFLDRADKDYLVLESRNRPGTFFEQYPRHEKLLSINKIHTGYEDREAKRRYDWNSLICDDDFAFTEYSKEYFATGKEYARYLCDFAAKFELQIEYETSVTKISRESFPNGPFLVTDQQGNVYRCRCLVVATGYGKTYIPDIPGIELTENYADFSIEPEDYINQKVLIIGKGNSAFETANHLTHVTRVTHLCSPTPIKLAWNSHYFGHLRAVNNDFLDTYILKGQNSVLDANIDKIEKIDDELVVHLTFAHAEDQKAVFAYDRILTCTGFRWDPSFFADECQPELACNGKLPAMTSSWESPNVPNLFFAGTVMCVRDFHKTMSNVLHGFRSNILSLSRILLNRFSAEELPYVRVETNPGELADKIIERVSSNAGLMHQPGFLCDVLVVPEEGPSRYYDCYAFDYVFDSDFAKEKHYYVITMEYGKTDGNPFAIDREPDPEKAYNDFYLHPRIRLFSGSEQIGEHHLSESLENDWRVGEHPGAKPLIREMHFHGQKDGTQFQQTHRSKLMSFFEQQLSQQTIPTEAL